MTKNRLFSLIMTLLVFTAAMSGAQLASAGDSVLSAIEKRGELVLGTSGNMPSMRAAWA